MAALDQRGLPVGYPYRADDEITPREVAALPAGSALLLDVRTQLEADICKLADSKLLPLQVLEAKLDELKADVDDKLDAPIVVYCHHGRRSLTATFMLRAAGFTNVRSMAGGIDLWSRAVDPKMPTY
jgi:rhodanese-related sulfurtransferase